MKILLLGSNGQLGSDIIRLSNSQPKRFEIIPVQRSQLNLLNSEEIYRFLNDQNFEVLINCAAYNRVDEAEFKNISEAFQINSHAVRIFAEICSKKKSRFIHVSTDYVFDGSKNEPYLETDLPSPLNIYGSSKALGEKFTQALCSNSLILRVASLFGIAGSSGKGGNFVETILRTAKEKSELRVVNDIRMSPTSTYRVAKIILKLVELEADPGIYHTVNSGEASWFEFAKEITEQTKLSTTLIPIKSTEYLCNATRPPYTVLNNEKISITIGNIPNWKIDLNQYLKEKAYL